MLFLHEAYKEISSRFIGIGRLLVELVYLLRFNGGVEVGVKVFQGLVGLVESRLACKLRFVDDCLHVVPEGKLALCCGKLGVNLLYLLLPLGGVGRRRLAFLGVANALLRLVEIVFHKVGVALCGEVGCCLHCVGYQFLPCLGGFGLRFLLLLFLLRCFLFLLLLVHLLASQPVAAGGYELVKLSHHLFTVQVYARLFEQVNDEVDDGLQQALPLDAVDVAVLVGEGKPLVSRNLHNLRISHRLLPVRVRVFHILHILRPVVVVHHIVEYVEA